MMKRIWWISLLAVVALVMVTVALGEKTPEAEKNVTPISDSELIEMMYDPEEATLIGETIRVEGYYGVFDEDTEDPYYYLVIAEPGSCCAETIEFIPDAGHRNFPEPDTLVALTGTLVMAQEDGYLRIQDATLSWE